MRARPHRRDFARLRAGIDLQHQIGAEHRCRRRIQRDTGLTVGCVGKAGGRAGARLDRDLVAGLNQLLARLGHQRDAALARPTSPCGTPMRMDSALMVRLWSLVTSHNLIFGSSKPGTKPPVSRFSSACSCCSTWSSCCRSPWTRLVASACTDGNLPLDRLDLVAHQAVHLGPHHSLGLGDLLAHDGLEPLSDGLVEVAGDRKLRRTRRCRPARPRPPDPSTRTPPASTSRSISFMAARPCRRPS